MSALWVRSDADGSCGCESRPHLVRSGSPCPGGEFKDEQVIVRPAILYLAATALRVRLCTLDRFFTADNGIEFPISWESYELLKPFRDE